MQQGITSKIRVVRVELGFSRLEDGTLITHRVAVADVRVAQLESPFGVEFEVSFTTGISAHPPREVLEAFKDKRVLAPGEKPPDSWRQLEIKEKKPAVEEVEFEDSKLGKYLITVEIEPVMASVNTEVRTVRGEPLYVVRWAPKVMWRKVEESELGGGGE